MSEWYEVDPEDIDIDLQEKEVSFLVCGNEHGNIYLSLSFDQIKDIANKISTDREAPGVKENVHVRNPKRKQRTPIQNREVWK
jgi:hypothetical protein